MLLTNVNLKAQENLHKNIASLSFASLPENSSISKLEQIFQNDVLAYFSNYIDSKYNSKLKKDLFLKSQEYLELKDSIKKIQSSFVNKFYIVKIKEQRDYHSYGFIHQYEHYDLDKKLKSIVIGVSEVIQGTGNVHEENVFGDFYFANISYKKSSYNSSGTFNYNFQIRTIDIQMNVDDALKYDEKELEVYVVYSFDGLNKGHIISNYCKIIVTYRDEIIYEKEFAKKVISSNNGIPFIGTKQLTDEAYATDYLITIRKDKTCLIKMFTGRGSSEKTIYKGVFKNSIKTSDGIIQISNSYIELLDSKGNIRRDCIKTVNNEYVDCECRFNITTLDLE